VPYREGFLSALVKELGLNYFDNGFYNILNNPFNNNLIGNVTGICPNSNVSAMQPADLAFPEDVELIIVTTSTPVPSIQHGVAPNIKKPTCLCGGKFSRMDSLRRHIQTRPTLRGSITSTVQSGGRYYCIHCDRHPDGFQRRDHLRQHLGGGYHKLSKQTIDVYLQVQYGS
jgi:hypothetical protein